MTIIWLASTILLSMTLGSLLMLVRVLHKLTQGWEYIQKVVDISGEITTEDLVRAFSVDRFTLIRRRR